MDQSFLSRADIQPVDSGLSNSTPLDSSRFSLNVMTTLRWNFLQDIFSSQELGVQALGLWRNKLENFGIEKGIDLVKEEGLEISSLSWAGGFTGSHGLSFYDAIEDGFEAIDIAHALGTKTLIVMSGAKGNHIESHVFKTVTRGLHCLSDYAGEKGVTLALLPMHQAFEKKWTFLNTIDQTLDVLASCNHPNVKMVFNTYHLGSEPDVLDRIPALVELIDLVQIADCETVPERENDRCLPGEGILPVAEIVSELLENGYQNYFEVDVWSKELWRSDYMELVSGCQTSFENLLTPEKQEVSRLFS